jgi:hypothetical protein
VRFACTAPFVVRGPSALVHACCIDRWYIQAQWVARMNPHTPQRRRCGTIRAICLHGAVRRAWALRTRTRMLHRQTTLCSRHGVAAQHTQVRGHLLQVLHGVLRVHVRHGRLEVDVEQVLEPPLLDALLVAASAPIPSSTLEQQRIQRSPLDSHSTDMARPARVGFLRRTQYGGGGQ